ncbi:hypothetical protein E4U32_007176 [Claviceps aff. humidiphila group G2b]|nr:hypothetical protein E4U32_007176 [Claviceps aff. humidiphila group G2b]
MSSAMNLWCELIAQVHDNFSEGDSVFFVLVVNDWALIKFLADVSHCDLVHIRIDFSDPASDRVQSALLDPTDFSFLLEIVLAVVKRGLLG